MFQVKQTQTHFYAIADYNFLSKLCLYDIFTLPPGNGLGIRVVGGKEIPGSQGEIGAYIANIIPGGVAEQTGKVVEGKTILREEGGMLVNLEIINQSR